MSEKREKNTKAIIQRITTAYFTLRGINSPLILVSVTVFIFENMYKEVPIAKLYYFYFITFNRHITHTHSILGHEWGLELVRNCIFRRNFRVLHENFILCLRNAFGKCDSCPENCFYGVA